LLSATGVAEEVRSMIEIMRELRDDVDSKKEHEED
jgi:hypothetical protein